MAIAWLQEQAAQDQHRAMASRAQELLEAGFEDSMGYLLMTLDRQALGMTVEQARQSEAATVHGDHSWI